MSHCPDSFHIKCTHDSVANLSQAGNWDSSANYRLPLIISFSGSRSMHVLFILTSGWICFSFLSVTLNRRETSVATLVMTAEDLRDLHHLVKSNERHLKIKKGVKLDLNLLKLCRLCRCLSQKTCAQTTPDSKDFSQNTRQTSGFYSAGFDREEHSEVLKTVFYRARRRTGVSLLACSRQDQLIQLIFNRKQEGEPKRKTPDQDCRGFAFNRSQEIYPCCMSQTSNPFARCFRFSACSKTMLCLLSRTSSVTSRPRLAGRQCINWQLFAAAAIRLELI